MLVSIFIMENKKTFTEYYLEHQLTMFLDENKSVWIKGSDVTSILGYVKSTDVLKKDVDDEDKVTLSNNSIYVNEYGLHCMIFKSNLVSGKKLKTWFNKKLPNILKLQPVEQKFDDAQLKL